MRMATRAKQWTLAEVHRLPDDGNKYELVRGELFVTPPPGDTHETIGARLVRILDPFVEREGLGFVYRPRSVVRYDGSEVEPDLTVRQAHPAPTKMDSDWDNAPTPILIVEVHSGSTRRRDRVQKRSLYMDAGIAEYWMVDPERQLVTVVRAGHEDLVVRDEMTWHPAGASAPLTFAVSRAFEDRRSE